MLEPLPENLPSIVGLVVLVAFLFALYWVAWQR